MKFIKEMLPLKNRIGCLWSAIRWLFLTKIPCYHSDDGSWTMEDHDVWSRLSVAKSAFKMFLNGVVYRVECEA